MENFLNFLTTRHSLKPKAEVDPESSYQGISGKGLELAKERASEILESFKNEPKGAVMFLAGASELPRTKNTAEIYGEEISKIISEKNYDDMAVITKRDISKHEGGYTEIATEVKKEIEAQPDKKFIIDIPLFVKELGTSNRWGDGRGGYSKYVMSLLTKYNNDEEECIKDWILNEGKLDGEVGPNPTKLAEEQLAGFKRLEDFAKKFLGDRPLVIGSVGHSWNLDALAVYLANNGKVDLEGYEKLGVKMIKETQLMRVGKNKENESVFFYNNQEYKLDKEIEG